METTPAWTLPANAEISAILAERIDKQRDGVGIVVGVADEMGGRVVAHGRFKRGSRRRVAGDSIFAIGSITKVFTSLLLSDMALRGEVDLDDPVAKHLPEGVTMPERSGRHITLADLATHTSGLPRLPTNFAPKDTRNPYADYTVEQLYTFLSTYTLTRDIGTQYDYSNVGAGLLGHVLARRLSTDYESLIKERVAGPLGLHDTSSQLSRDQRKRLVDGHDTGGRPLPHWNLLEATAGAGALYSTANDLLAFLAVALGHEDAPLKAAIDAQLAYPMRKAAHDVASVGLGWHATESARGRLVWHTGDTTGFRAVMSLDPERGWGVVVLTNAFTTRGAADICQHVLAGTSLAPAPKRRRAMSVAPSVLDGYVGRYRYADGRWIDIQRVDDDLLADVPGVGVAPIFAASSTKFFWRAFDAELAFDVDGDGRAIALTTRSAARGEHCAVRES